MLLRAYATWIARQEIPDLNSGMRVFRRSLVERFFNILPDGFSFTTTITLAMLTNRYSVRYVPIGYSARIGKSKIKPIQDTYDASSSSSCARECILRRCACIHRCSP